MSEWKKVKLGELCDFINGGAWSDKEYVEEGIPVLKVTNCKNSGFSLSDLSFLPYSLEQKYIQNKLQIHDVIIATVGSHPNLVNSSAGRSVIANSFVKGFYLNQNAVCVRTKNENILNQLYWGYYSKYYLFQNYIQMRGKGAANQMRIAISAIKDYPMPLPPISYQKHIATILSRYDSLIENYQKQIKLLEEAAQRLYKEWFVDLRFPGHENSKIVDGVPEGWEKKKLGDITCKFATGLNPRKNFVLGHGNNYYVTIKNMANNDIIFDDKCDKIDNDALEKINKRSDLQQGDLLFSGIGTIGRVYLIDKPVRDWNISESVFTMRPIPRIPSTFLYLVLLDKDIQDYCQSNAHGCAQKGIRMADLKSFEVLVPSKDILEIFSKEASNLIRSAKHNANQIRLLSEARDRLLPKLMNGEIKA